ncbi:homocysteine S-methyltransferase family protein [Candidatus Pelagibacter sp.]|nr:homocysteine S-methyltransferase family protein [Candidatus Pelagibacter bacterium]MDC1112896.1 homocysteine S-methyltransferase family protein [Candidatus Pelagibacter sp.]
MDLNFFKKTRVLDGGMGQELLARGMKPNGTLWSANAILDKNYHQLLSDTHRDFVKAGAEVIVTTTFTTRRKRLRDNDVEDKFEYLNKKAGQIALDVKKEFPNILVAGGIPPQNLTYEADDRNEEEIAKNFNEQAKLLNPYVDFFYFDVWSSIKEFKCGIEAIKEFKKPYLIGIHISEGTNLPSGENISDIKSIIDEQLLGIMLSCVSPENYEANLEELKSLNVPFGFKINGFITTKPKDGYTSTFTKSNGNPNEFLGQREDLTPQKIGEIVKKFKDNGATILGGCCEIRPSHINAMATIV